MCHSIHDLTKWKEHLFQKIGRVMVHEAMHPSGEYLADLHRKLHLLHEHIQMATTKYHNPDKRHDLSLMAHNVEYILQVLPKEPVTVNIRTVDVHDRVTHEMTLYGVKQVFNNIFEMFTYKVLMHKFSDKVDRYKDKISDLIVTLAKMHDVYVDPDNQYEISLMHNKLVILLALVHKITSPRSISTIRKSCGMN